MVDVIVVGAGIGGASAALFLRQAGLSVLVLEREALPHARTCAGGVPMSVLRQFPFDPDEVIAQEVSRVRFVLGDREVSYAIPPRSIVTVRRERLDARVLQASGAEVRDRCEVREVVEGGDRVVVRSAAGEEWTARSLIGADGYSSAVARSLGLRRGHVLVPAVESQIATAPLPERYRNTAEFAFGRLYGYIWVFPKRDHLSVGAVAFRRGRVDLVGALGEEMGRRGLDLDRATVRAHPLPIYRAVARLHGARTLLVGDAAGLVDPLQGEGIRHAVHSARIAAGVIASNAALAEYTRMVQASIGRSLARARTLAGLLYRWPRVAWRLVIENPRTTAEMFALFDGRQDYVALSHRLPGIALGSLPAHGQRAVHTGEETR